MKITNALKQTLKMGLVCSSLCFSLSAKAESAFTAEEMYSNTISDFLVNLEDAEFDYPINGVEVDDNCKKFMNENMVLGPLGQYIKNELIKNSKFYPNLMASSQMKSLCPKYSKMNLNNQAFIWTLVLTTMAHYESSCDIKVSIKGPNGRTSGYWQLHNGKEQNYDGPSTTCFKYAGKDPKGSSRCALAMLDLQIKNNNGLLFTKKSYWDVLRPSGHASKISKAPQKIRKALTKHKTCY